MSEKNKKDETETKSRVPSLLADKTGMSRRKYIAVAGGAVAVAAVAGTAGWYLLNQPPAESTPQNDPLIFDMWAFGPDTVQTFLNEFETEYSEKTRLEVLSGGDYAALAETKHMTNAPIDVMYAFPYDANRWYYAGWIRDLEDMADIATIKSEMYPGILKAFQGVNGKLLGLPYFTATHGIVMTNELLLDKAGLKDQPPADFAELYAQCREIKRLGVAENPYLPRIFGAEEPGFWVWLGDAHNRGDEMWDPTTFEPVFDVNTPAADVLRDWKALWDENIIPHGILTMTEGDHIGAFATGKYAYSQQNTYDAKRFNDPTFSKFAGNCSFVPVSSKQKEWGLLNASLYVVCNRTRTAKKLQRVHQMEKFFGWKNKNSEYWVAKQWSLLSALNSGYPAILDDTEVIASYDSWLYKPGDLKVLSDVLAASWLNTAWKTPWYTPWQVQMNQKLPQVLQGTLSVNDCITQLRDLATQLNKDYPPKQM